MKQPQRFFPTAVPLQAVSIPVERQAFVAELERALKKNTISDGAEREHIAGILMLDLVRFSRINALYGYEVGDLLIFQVIERLKSQLKPHGAIVKRIGSDEFGVFLPDLHSTSLLSLALNKVIRILSEGFSVKGQQHTLEIQIGAAQYPHHGSNVNELMLAAEQALLEAKHTKRTSVILELAEETDSQKQWDIEKELKEAIHDNELEFYFQPKLDLRTGYPAHAEALLRWDSSSHGKVSPLVFIPVAESAGFLDELTRWALNTALRLSRDWPSRWGVLPVAVNISASNIHYKELQDMVQSALRIWGRRPQDLTLEITESAIMLDKQAAFNNLSQIRETGVQVSIDDFGTGYSSLEYFKQIPANELKIDQSFVANMLQDQADQKLVELIIDLAHKFGLSVVAEGVEDEHTLRRLKSMGCDFAQGFHIAHPMSQEEFINWLLAYNADKYFRP